MPNEAVIVTQEPVAWLYEKGGKQSLQITRQEWNTAPDRGWSETPLYSHTPDPAGLREALEEIVHPIAAMQTFAKENGLQLDGAVALALANDPEYLRRIARTALATSACAGLSENDRG
jgi:hypothetical protein